jgi:hypothetical protein
MRRAPALVIPLFAMACASALPAPRPTPAPAPAARGFRAATPEGVELVFDARLRTYTVAGQPGVYWLDGRFFRRARAGWEASPRLDGPWQACAAGDLPEGLRGEL